MDATSAAVGALLDAVDSGDIDSVREMLDYVKNLLDDDVGAADRSCAGVNAADDSGYTALFCAAQGGHVALVNMLIGEGAEVDKTTADGRTPLFTASFEGYAEVVKALIEAKA